MIITISLELPLQNCCLCSVIGIGEYILYKAQGFLIPKHTAAVNVTTKDWLSIKLSRQRSRIGAHDPEQNIVKAN